jgi:D-tyrosyl-tRNA(Tyr) deacylase
MKAVVQRVFDASVSVGGVVKGRIDNGLLVYLGVSIDDDTRDADWLAEKIINLRIFDDPDGKMNLSVVDVVNQDDNKVNITYVNHEIYEVNNIMVNLYKSVVNNNAVNHDNTTVNQQKTGILAVSQFTLLGDARKGRRPSWAKAAPPEKANELYRYFITRIEKNGILCESGEFQAHMMVKYTNDGPVTILLDSRE